MLLDLLVAFDSIDHGMLLDRLEECFGIQGDVLRWVAGYLSDRCQLISNLYSEAFHNKISKIYLYIIFVLFTNVLNTVLKL